MVNGEFMVDADVKLMLSDGYLEVKMLAGGEGARGIQLPLMVSNDDPTWVDD